jgi:hypothetical protein
LNRKLVVLNLSLVGAVVYAGMDLRRQWVAAKEREAQIQRTAKVAPAAALPFTRQPEVAPVMASGYAKIAQNFLLDPSRNPDVPIPAPPPPPPPPVMPPLPLFHGMMNIGDGPEIIMSVNAAAAHKRLHAGETIGEFQVVAFNADQVELEWNGQRMTKTLAEIAGHGAGPQQASETSQADAAPATRAAPAPAAYGPDKAENSAGEHACVDGDTTAVGTEKDGLVKTMVRNALLGSENCIWRPVRH